MDLNKELTFIDVFSVATGAMISSGIFILPGLAFSKAGPAVIVSYFLAGILAMVGIMSIIELATAMPKAGGDYYFINRSLGPLAGVISGFLGWLALSLKSAFAIFGIAELIYVTTGTNVIISSVLLCVFFVLLNIKGVKEAANLQVYLVLGLLALMTFYIISGLPKIEPARFAPFTPKGLKPMFITAGFIFISFGGLLKVAGMSEEVKNPKKNIPLGMITSVAVITVLYTLMLIATVGILDPATFANSLTPIADAAKNILGTPGFIIISVAALLAFITTANAGIMSASRYPLALSRDKLLPDFISKVSKKNNTPVVAISITGLLIATSLLLPLEILVKAASTVILTSYVLTNLAVIILRESNIHQYRPSFKAPLYPWLQIFGIIVFSFFIFVLGLQAIEISLSFLIVTVLFYYLYGKKRFEGEYALLHLIERITAKELTTNSLQQELKKVIRERDALSCDKFDVVVERSDILDIKEKMTAEELFKKISHVLAQKTDIGADAVSRLLYEREKDTSTVIGHGIAIPHIVVEGENLFELLLVRAKEGIEFSDTNEDIKVIFVIAGTKDKRNLHLRVLSSLAQICQDEKFMDRWLKAKNEESLRDVILMGDRMR